MTKNDRPWNAGRFVGSRLAFTIKETQDIAEMLYQQDRLKELCVFCFGIDSMLRVSDLSQVRVKDILDHRGGITTTFVARQKKTSQRVAPVLTQHTRSVCKLWIARNNSQPNDFLFPRRRDPHQPASSSWFRYSVKRWAENIDLPSDNYSAHSLRRTKAHFLYFNCGVEQAVVAKLLGHQSIDATLTYLGVLEAQAQQAALAGDIFTAKINEDKVGREVNMSEESIKKLVKQIGRELAHILTSGGKDIS